jgi:hypothetical protein
VRVSITRRSRRQDTERVGKLDVREPGLRAA